MAIFCGSANSAPLIKVAKDFQNLCLIDGKSLFTQKPIWTPEHVEELVKYFVENLDEGEGNFLSKLATQLAPASSEAKVVLAEMLWLMSLCPSNVGPSSKRDTVQRVFAFSGENLIDTVPVDIQAAYLSDEVLTGIGKTGAAYSTGRWRELVYFIRLLTELFKLSPKERSDLLASREEFSNWLEAIPESNKRQFRHMILYLFYPEEQERTFSDRHRQSLLSTFSNISPAQFKKMTPHEVDNQLLAIRKKLEQEYSTKELDYYVEPLKSRWNYDIESPFVAEQAAGYQSKDKIMTKNVVSLNQILYGPPGTGKTYNTIYEALSIVDPESLTKYSKDHDKVKARFDELVASNRIGFVTFHQSFSYEDFVEGLKANSNDEGQISYDVEDGVFKSMCMEARVSELNLDSTINSHGRVWKISIESTNSNPAKDYCLENNIGAVGWSETGDLSSDVRNEYFIKLGKNNQNSLNNFSQYMAIGDLVVCIDSNTSVEAVGVVAGNYAFTEAGIPSRPDFCHQIPITWIAKGFSVDFKELNNHKQFHLPTCYPLKRLSVPEVLGHLTYHGVNLSSDNVASSKKKEQKFVLIIDEINRGNISNIFGELITLIEPSKRTGEIDALSVRLPYSKDPFSVPSNLHIIGTMNTADKSLAQVDIALRRRFEFVEMMPKHELLSGVDVVGIDIARLLETINQRIELLYDREHTIGHSFFLPLINDPSIDRLARIFEREILPLLEEYFFEDWERVGQVLGDHRKADPRLKFIKEKFTDDKVFTLMGNAWSQEGIRPFQRNMDALENPEAYIGIYGLFSG